MREWQEESETPQPAAGGGFSPFDSSKGEASSDAHRPGEQDAAWLDPMNEDAPLHGNSERGDGNEVPFPLELPDSSAQPKAPERERMPDDAAFAGEPIPVREPKPPAPSPVSRAPVSPVAYREEVPRTAVPVAPAWFAVRVQSNKEDSVKRNLERRIELRGLAKKILQVVVPTEKVAEIKGGKKRTRQVKTYPGYVLVEMLMDDETWAFVRETAGVGDFVGGGGNIHQKPFPLRPDEVNKIFGLELPGEESPKIKIDFSVGDKVKIREGPFENFDGVVEEINEQKGLVRVTVTIFGRATPVELQYWQVEAI